MIRQLLTATSLFAMLAVAAQGGRAECPGGMVAGPSFCIDEYEWPNEKGTLPASGLSLVRTYYDEQAKRPVLDMETLCGSVEKRLCTPDEWYVACLGTHASRCNTAKRWRKPDEAKVAARDEAEMTRLDQREPSGSSPLCVSRIGAHDMLGNVEEWTEGAKLKGRFWAEPTSCARTVGVHAPNWHYYETGGRCCTDR